MIHFERTTDIDATSEAVWAVLGRYMHIHEFAPQVVSVDALTDGEDGVGSKRRCHFENGSSVVEEVTEWEAGKRYRVCLSEMEGMPVNEMYAEISIDQIGNGKTKVTWGIDYQVKYGPLGWLLGQTMMKMMMGKILDGNLKGLTRTVLANQNAISNTS